MTDIPEEIAEAARAVSARWFPFGHHDEAALHEEVSQALLSERRKQIERDAKIADDFEPSGWLQIKAAEAIAAAIRAQQEP